MDIDGDADAYREVLAEARHGDATVEDLREPLDDRTFSLYATPLYMLQERPGEVEEYEEDGTTVREIPSGPAYRPAEDAYTVDGRMLTDIHTGLESDGSRLGRAASLVLEDLNPFHHYGRHRAVMDMPLDGDPDAAARRYSRRGTAALVGGTLIGGAALAAGVAGGLLDAPTVEMAGDAVLYTDVAGIWAARGYYGGAVDETRGISMAQTANTVVADIGDSALRVEPDNNAVEGFFAALDPDAETPDWLDGLER